MTRIAILETGFPPRALQPRFGTYTDMFRAILGDTEVEGVYDVTHGQWPEAPGAHGAYLITGSSAGVYDDLPWIEPLKDFLRAAKGKAKLTGICFGHQIMAESFGGQVAKSDKGWGIGLQDYNVARTAPWLNGENAVVVPVVHQDQVIVQPPNSTVIGGNDFCPFGILAYEDQPALSVQCHPEFDPAYVDAIIDTIGDDIPDPKAARASLARTDDRLKVAGWIKTFLTAV